MLSTFQFGFLALSLISASEPVLGRERWLERDGRAIQLNPRRFGQEHPPVIDKLAAACPGGICGTLAGGAITPLLAAQPECSQQDFADKIIETSRQFDAATQATMLALAIEYRQAEKNTPPDFSTNPPTPRNSVFCQKAPANAALNGLVQAQDPANGPDIFFDPARGNTVNVKLGSQPNTIPFGGKASESNVTASTSAAAAATTTSAVAETSAATSTEDCVTATVTVTASVVAASLAAEATDCPSPTTVTVTASATGIAAVATTAAATGTTTAASTGSTSAIGNFGKCSLPEIKFAVGLDGRRETSFEPVDKTSYPHTSAQNINIITEFICNELVNTCGADATAKTTCANARAAVTAVTPKIGLQADTFNKFFGKTTNFAAVAAVDNQGNVIAGTATA